MNERKLISKFKRNPMEEVRVSLKSNFGMLNYVEICIWEMLEPCSEEALHPTKKGLSLSTMFLPKLIKALEDAQEISKKEADKDEQYKFESGISY